MHPFLFDLILSFSHHLKTTRKEKKSKAKKRKKGEINPFSPKFENLTESQIYSLSIHHHQQTLKKFHTKKFPPKFAANKSWEILSTKGQEEEICAEERRRRRRRRRHDDADDADDAEEEDEEDEDEDEDVV